MRTNDGITNSVQAIADDCWTYGCRWAEETPGGDVWWRRVEERLAVITPPESPERQLVRRWIRERLDPAPVGLVPTTSEVVASCSRCGALFATGCGRHAIPGHAGEYCGACVRYVRAGEAADPVRARMAEAWADARCMGGSK